MGFIMKLTKTTYMPHSFALPLLFQRTQKLIPICRVGIKGGTGALIGDTVYGKDWVLMAINSIP